MNKLPLTFIAWSIVFFTSCTTYVQVFDTQSNNSQDENDLYVYETDTLKIFYAFWANKGLMSFAIYNKLDKPLYVDWKKSSYIDNSNKLDYWVDEEISSSGSIYGSYYYDGPLLRPGYAVSATAAAGLTATTKIERITFIPPKSFYYRSQFYILPVSFYRLDINADMTTVPRNDKPKKNTKIYMKEYTKDNSPLIFRNFLAFSFSENFENEFYVDSEFYISNIQEMDKRHFEFYKMQGNFIEKDEDGNYVYNRPYQKETSFYLLIPKEGSIESRK